MACCLWVNLPHHPDDECSRHEVLLWLAPLAFLATLALAQPTTPSPDDDEIARRLIEASIARYAGSCPCPYSTARNGSRCGRRSAHDRPGGEAPLCFREDVSDEAIARYRARMVQE